jgi:hypothetical protein
MFIVLLQRIEKERLPSVDLLQRGRTRAGAEWGGSGMQRARKWAPTILHNVFTCCHLHTLCNSPVTYPALRCPVAEFGASRAAEWQILAKRGDLDPM